MHGHDFILRYEKKVDGYQYQPNEQSPLTELTEHNRHNDIWR